MTQIKKRKIAVLDDDQIQHILFKKRAAQIASDIHLHFFEEPEILLEFIKTQQVETIVSDLNLESMSGWDFIDQLFKLGFEGKVFIMTSSIISGDRAKAKKEKRIYGFYEKPLSDSNLIQILTA
jgi:DNA-binding NtrC family response regulator